MCTSHVERTAGNLGSAGSRIRFANHPGSRLCVEVLERTAGDHRGRRTAAALIIIGMDNLRLSIGSARIRLRERTTGDRQIAVVEHDAGKAIRITLCQRKRTTGDGQGRAGLVLNVLPVAVTVVAISHWAIRSNFTGRVLVTVLLVKVILVRERKPVPCPSLSPLVQLP